ncbi:unnamed protein product, partial [Allacma fusca]
TAMMVTDANVAELWKLDTIGIRDATECQTREDLEHAAMEYFQRSTTRLPDGRFEVALPWVEGHPILPSNEEVARKRLEVPVDELENSSHYLPHRAVIKDSSETTKVRPVFDASSKPKGGVSLNDCL